MNEQKVLEKTVYGSGDVEGWGPGQWAASSKARRVWHRVRRAARHGARQVMKKLLRKEVEDVRHG